MKVYIIAEAEVFETNEIKAVFDSRQKADKYVKDNISDFITPIIYEWEVS